jgi:predicted HAD superfamily Cof-like phosphohydrolase
MSLEAQVRQFNHTYKVSTSSKPRLPNREEAVRLLTLIDEEREELKEAIDNRDIVEIADALADILYVTAQQAVTLGFPIDALLREVQRSNMSKLGEDGEPIFREDGKVLKGPNFSEPELKSILVKHGAVI